MFKNSALKLALAVGSLVVAGASQAAVDVTAITAAATDIGLVGAAVFAIYVAVKGFHWVRRAL